MKTEQNEKQNNNKNPSYIFEVSRGAAAQVRDCKFNWLWVRSRLEEIKYFFKWRFSFLRPGVEAKRCVEFCHSTRNAFSIGRKKENGVS